VLFVLLFAVPAPLNLEGVLRVRVYARDHLLLKTKTKTKPQRGSLHEPLILGTILAASVKKSIEKQSKNELKESVRKWNSEK